jgi:soluble lytic murein transglycosylase
MLAAVSPAMRHDPFLVLEQARWLRKAGQDDAALAVWQTLPPAAMATVAPDRQPAFWSERHLLTRRRLRIGDAAGAYALAAGHGQTDPEQAADAEFLAGWIALRRLNDPTRAIAHFQRLASLSGALITQARAHYWLGRAAQAQFERSGGDKATATQQFAAAAAWPTTYYGQLAALAAGDDTAALTQRIAKLRDPAWDDGQALDFAGREVARAAALLVSWGDPDRARPFLLRLEDLAPGAAERAMAARLALGFGLPDQAITIARRAGRDGVMLPAIGWPTPYEPPANTIEPALALGVIRQESNFNVGVVSSAGARGLMQLMPGTAQLVAKQLGTRVDTTQLTTDPDANMKLGTAYMESLMAQFADFMPMAIAAYNAGPGRAVQWAAENGDPRTGAIDPIDWIELIPFNETRNYVQRVIENVVIYRARRGVVADHPAANPAKTVVAATPGQG